MFLQRRGGPLALRLDVAGHDRDQVVLLPILTDDDAVGCAARRAGQIVAGHAGPAGSLVIEQGNQGRNALAPIGADFLGVGAVAQDLRALFRQAAQRRGIGIGRSAETRLDFPVVKRPDGVLPDADHRLGNVVPDPGVRVGHQLIHTGVRFRIDDDLGVGGVGIFAADRQVEPRRPLADKSADGQRRLMLLQELFDPLQVGAGLLNSRALRGPVVDHELQPAGVRKIHLLHEAETEDGDDQQPHHAPQEQHPVTDGQGQELPEGLVELALIRIGLGLAGLGARQDGDAQQRGRGLAEDPAQDQRNRHHREQAPGDFARVVGRGENRVERHASDHRRPQQRPGRPAGRFDGRLLAIHAWPRCGP